MAKTITASDIIIIGLFCSGALNFDVLALQTQDRYLGERAGQCMPTTMDKHCGIRSFSCQPSRSRTQSFQENRLTLKFRVVLKTLVSLIGRHNKLAGTY